MTLLDAAGRPVTSERRPRTRRIRARLALPQRPDELVAEDLSVIAMRERRRRSGTRAPVIRAKRS